jgi:two-component system, OmpR family, KDP operon response regulator KdpE
MTIPAAILVIDDEANTRALLQWMLAQRGYQCLLAANGADGVAMTLRCEPNVILLDLGLPDLDGVDVTLRIRERCDAPIIVVSAKEREADKIAALDAGANDYVTKPFVAGELLARIRVALRSLSQTDTGPPTGTVTVGDLLVDFDLRRVAVAGREVRLSTIEYNLLAVLMRSPGRVLTHQQILRQVWGPRYAAHMNYLRVYMKKLRHKIELEPARPKYLVNELGVGYRLQLPS